jgi:hypothetical protein
VKKRKGINMTIEQADAHQRKHGFKPVGDLDKAVAQARGILGDPTKKTTGKGRLRNVRKRVMNKTEREFSFILEAQKRTAEIDDWKFEGVRLLWGGGMTYTADFSVRRTRLEGGGRIKVVEVKGVHIRDRDIVRFKGCRHEWEEWFDFEFHQRRKDGTWHRLL